MKKIFCSIFLLLLASCGEYVENKIDLDQTQEDAIENYLTLQCITDNAVTFNQLAANTVDFANSDLDAEYLYEYKATNKDPATIAILKKTSTEMFIYVETNDPETSDRVYKYTTTDNANHIAAVKTMACKASNTFSGDANSFSYLPVYNSPNETDPDRTIYSSSYVVQGFKPVFFSLFNRRFTKTSYEEDVVKTNVTVDVSYNITTTLLDLDTFEDEFNNADHCVFNTAAPITWLDADFPDSFSATTLLSCSSGAFNWTTDIKTL